MGYSICGMARLLKAIGDQKDEWIEVALGLPLGWLEAQRPRRCAGCSKPIDHGNKTGYCPSCRSQALRIDVACSECDRLFKLRAKFVIYRTAKNNQQYFFCNRPCHGRWLNKNYGFAVHPENIQLGSLARRKWDSDLVWQKHLETGYGAARLSRVLGIPTRTITSILRRKKQGLQQR